MHSNHTFKVRLAALLDDGQHADMMDLLARMSGEGWDGDLLDMERTFMLIDEVVKEYDLVIEVDREVWRSVDRHSADRYIFTIDLPKCVLTDDVLEGLADDEDWRESAEWAVRNNEWETQIQRLVD